MCLNITQPVGVSNRGMGQLGSPRTAPGAVTHLQRL